MIVAPSTGLLDPSGRSLHKAGEAPNVVELVRDIVDAEQKMSAKNPHKYLLRQCAVMLVQMAGQIDAARKETIVHGS